MSAITEKPGKERAATGTDTTVARPASRAARTTTTTSSGLRTEDYRTETYWSPSKAILVAGIAWAIAAVFALTHPSQAETIINGYFGEWAKAPGLALADTAVAAVATGGVMAIGGLKTRSATNS